MNTLLAMSVAVAVALASPSPAGQDLSKALAPPAGSDWFEESATATVIDGPFTVHQYAMFLQAAGDTAQQAADNESALNSYGMTGGYGREWEQRSGARDLLVERVFAFQGSSGADSWYADLKDGAETAKDFSSDFPTEQSVPNSFGVILKSTDGTNQYRVDFKYQNLVFVIHADSLQNDLKTFALGQATAEWDMQARPTPSPSAGRAGSGAASIHTPPNFVVIALVSTGALVLLAITIGVVLFLLSRTGGRPATTGYAPATVQMSPDRAYWWDGVQWRPADTSTPPAAPRSPDGAHWWDGASWRPVR